MFGGAAGGGKSDALLMGALQFMEVPGYAAIIFRRTLKDLTLPGALLDRAKDWLGPTEAVWHNGQWVFPSGATLSFGYLQHEKQKFRYQSSEFQYVAFDELTQFSESQYRYLFSRLRRPKHAKGALARVPLRMRSASNPGGVGHEWVRRRFIDSSHPQRRFVPSSLRDNPYVDADSYEQSLMMLDPVTRKQLLEGDWSVRQTGGYFDRKWFANRILDPDEVPGNLVRTLRYFDLASTEEDPLQGNDPDWSATCKMSMTGDGRFVIHDVQRTRKNPGDVEQWVRAVVSNDDPANEVWFEQEPGSSGKSLISYYRRYVLPERAVYADPKSGDKETRATPLSARCHHGDVELVRGAWHTDFFDEAETFPMSSHDDMVDAASGAFHCLTRREGPGIVAPTGMIEPSAWRM